MSLLERLRKNLGLPEQGILGRVLGPAPAPTTTAKPSVVGVTGVTLTREEREALGGDEIIRELSPQELKELKPFLEEKLQNEVRFRSFRAESALETFKGLFGDPGSVKQAELLEKFKVASAEQRAIKASRTELAQKRAQEEFLRRHAEEERRR